MTAYQRRKGANGEREVCALLHAEFGINVKRKLGQARDSGNDVDLPPFTIEVKRRKRIAGVYDWMSQAEWATPDGYGMPCVFLRADGNDWLVLMQFRDWAKLAREELSCTTPPPLLSQRGASSGDSLPGGGDTTPLPPASPSPD